jgi:hypothetical protein
VAEVIEFPVSYVEFPVSHIGGLPVSYLGGYPQPTADAADPDAWVKLGLSPRRDGKLHRAVVFHSYYQSDDEDNWTAPRRYTRVVAVFTACKRWKHVNVERMREPEHGGKCRACLARGWE